MSAVTDQEEMMERTFLVRRVFVAILLLALAPLASANAAAAPQADPSPTLAEIGALQALYEATHGTGWTNRTGWLAGNACSWYGVHCEAASGDVAHVASPVLASNNLTGTLPAALGGMAWLKHLDLAANHLSGPIPPALGGIATPEGLWLGQNQHAGPLPAAPVLPGDAALVGLPEGGFTLTAAANGYALLVSLNRGDQRRVTPKLAELAARQFAKAR